MIRGGQDEIKGEKPLAAPVDLRDVERHRRGGASQAGRGELREKVIVKKKGCPKDDLPEKPVRSSFFFYYGLRWASPPARASPSGTTAAPRQGSNTQNQGSQGLKYPKSGVPGAQIPKNRGPS